MTSIQTLLTQAEVDFHISLYESDLSAARKSLVEIEENSAVLTVRCVLSVKAALLNSIYDCEVNIQQLKSFSASAVNRNSQKTTTVESLAVPDEVGQRGCFPFVVFPQPEFVSGVTSLVTGGCTSRAISEIRDDFWYSCDGCLDAPAYVASGGISSVTSYGKIRPVSVADRY